MKAKLEFEDGFEFRCAVNGSRMLWVLWELDQEMRHALKYDNRPCHKQKDDGMCYSDVAQGAAIEATEHWRGRLRDLCVENHINLEDDYEL